MCCCCLDVAALMNTVCPPVCLYLAGGVRVCLSVCCDACTSLVVVVVVMVVVVAACFPPPLTACKYFVFLPLLLTAYCLLLWLWLLRVRSE